MEKKSGIQKPSSNIRKPSTTKEKNVVTSEMRKNKKGDPQSQRVFKPEKEKEMETQSSEQNQQQPDAQLETRAAQKPERKIVNEDEQKQVVNNPGSDASPTEAEDQK